MGCDIHLYVEILNGDRWEHVPGEFWDDRSYDAFAILAGVRNSHGFVPIAPPRGLPADVSPEVKRFSDGWDIDGHSHSYHTLKQLLAYDWTQVGRKTGIIALEEYKNWSSYRKRRGYSPYVYCAEIGGGGVKVVDEDAVDTEGATHVRARWDEPYNRCAAGFLFELMPKLWRLGRPEDVRIVFWFDC